VYKTAEFKRSRGGNIRNAVFYESGEAHIAAAGLSNRRTSERENNTTFAGETKREFTKYPVSS
jgi:hypothetical protein